MATRKKSELEQELCTDANLAKVIKLLEQPEEGKKAITKKEACSIIGIAYNTTRLGTLIEAYKAKVERTAKRKAELRGKAATAEEVAYVIQEYIKGATVDSISTDTFRGATFIKAILEKYSVPLRKPGDCYNNPEMIPDAAVRTEFAVGEIVWSARYQSLARVDSEFPRGDEKVYRCWLLAEKWYQNCYQPASELASLEHLKELGVKL